MATAAFKVDDEVTFDDANSKALVGIITRITRLQTMDGRNSRVGFESM